MTPSTQTIEETLGLNGTTKRSTFKYWIIGAIVLILIALAIWQMSSNGEKTEYLTQEVVKKSLTTTVSATGNLEPTNTIDVGIEVSGTINEVLVDYNDRVRTGQIMARLDTTKLSSRVTSYNASLSRTQASISEAKATLKNAQNEWERVRKMFEATQGNYPSRQEMDNTSTTVERSKAQLAAATAQRDQSFAELQTAQDDLRKAVVVSPIDGIVLERKVEPGQTVVAAMQTPILFKMAKDLTNMKVIVSVDEADVGEVKESQKVLFSVDAYPNQKFNGIITQLRLNSQIVNGVVTYDAVVEVPNDDLRLRPGMTATAQIITGVLPNVLTVPNAALRFTPPKSKEEKSKDNINTNGKSVWVLRDAKPVKIDVTIGKSDGVSTVILTSKLKPNDNVIVGIKEH
ncbi:MAG TPA: efflux RND transporter periplasmic adaptor subunit [Sulfuricurvum sp.]|nr:efflux RND transporter periplasmic adaptor subunit [Sulfuricurvum sp.]